MESSQKTFKTRKCLPAAEQFHLQKQSHSPTNEERTLPITDQNYREQQTSAHKKTTYRGDVQVKLTELRKGLEEG